MINQFRYLNRNKSEIGLKENYIRSDLIWKRESGLASQEGYCTTVSARGCLYTCPAPELCSALPLIRTAALSTVTPEDPTSSMTKAFEMEDYVLHFLATTMYVQCF